MAAVLVKTLDNFIEISFCLLSGISLELSLICLSSWFTGTIHLRFINALECHPCARCILEVNMVSSFL